MREILFRGKSKKNGEWVFGHYLTLFGRPIIKRGENDADLVVVLPETIEEYTGYKDKHGKRIFEGDIVKYRYEWNNDAYAETDEDIDIKNLGEGNLETEAVTFEDGEFYPLPVIDWQEQRQCVYWDFEVIGNIHDNPELIKLTN